MQSKMFGKLPLESKDKLFVGSIRSIPTKITRDLGESSTHKMANLKQSVPRFGPVYSVKQEAVEAIKDKAWEHVLRNSPESDHGATKDTYSTAMRRVEQQAKEVYGGKATGKGSEFLWMMIKDGCLCNQVVLLMLGCSEQLGYDQSDPIFGRVLRKKATDNWLHALFYPGNQLPLVVLRVLMDQDFFQDVIGKASWDSVPSGLCKEKVLYELLVLPSLQRTHRRSLIERVGAVFVGGSCSGNDVEQPQSQSQPQPQPQHSNLLDGFRGVLMGPGPASQDHHSLSENKTDGDGETDSDGDHDEIGEANSQRNLCNATRILLSATELKQKGIHIKALKSGSGARDIRWKTNCLWAHIYLPTLQLDSNTESILRNLKNYESFQYPDQNRRELSLYLKIMSDLIDTARDAKLLQKNGIIHGNLNDVDELPAMLKRLTPEENIPLTQQVRILSTQIRDYFGLWAHYKPFITFVSFFAFIQALFSVLSYFKTPKYN